MSYSKTNATAATFTKNRTAGSVSPFSGMCATCIEGCTGLCEVGKSALRGSEVIYPAPYGTMTAASEKDYPIDYSHFNIMGTAVGAHGIESDSDKAIFPNVNIETEFGYKDKIKLKVPWFIPGLGSTNVAKINWDGLAIGSAISGSMLVIGENVVGMDPKSEFKNGRVVKAPDLAERVKLFQDWYDGYGTIVVQANVEDTRLGTLEYAISELGVDTVELKWGQGAKDIGGEVKIDNLEKALMLKSRGYVVLPDPEDPKIQAAFKAGVFTEFERHSRVGMVDEEDFMRRVEELRSLGAKHVFLKTGAYRPADLARAVKFASQARIDLLTVDGAGGGTGMSPWRMMNEWGVPTVYLQSLLYEYLQRIEKAGAYVPDVAIAGGFTLEDAVFKGLALSAPYTKAVGMGRGPLAAAMVGKTVGKLAAEGKLPRDLAKYGSDYENLFAGATELKAKYGSDFKYIPAGAIAVYTYYSRIAQGLKQLMCGARKFALKYIDRGDLASLTREAAELTGIPFVTELDALEVDEILSSVPRAEEELAD
ncbi:MAG: FMN-binding glutamate synthase family protein [Firmicutes bacterium]|nr:FMN-binding glutamate synthase family protein [Bacillota bacterium]